MRREIKKKREQKNRQNGAHNQSCRSESITKMLMLFYMSWRFVFCLVFHFGSFSLLDCRVLCLLRAARLLLLGPLSLALPCLRLLAMRSNSAIA
jgi:hypothetical protein